MLKIIKIIDDKIARAEYFVLIVLMVALTSILSLQVVLRYFFSSPLFWAEEVAVQIFICSSFVGISYLVFLGQLVRVDFIINYFTGKLRFYFELILVVVTFIVLFVICYHATEWILRPEIKMDISPTTGIPRWYNYLFLVVGFYFMSLHTFVKIITLRSCVYAGDFVLPDSNELDKEKDI